MRTETLPFETLEHALSTAKARALDQLVHHRDRGSHHVSVRYTDHLSEAGVQVSVGSLGDSYDCQSLSTRFRKDWGVPADAV